MFVEASAPITKDGPVRLVFRVASKTVEVEASVVRRVSPEDARAQGTLPGLGISFQRFFQGERAYVEFLQKVLKRVEAPALQLERSSKRPTRSDVKLPIRWSPRGPTACQGTVLNLSVTGAFIRTGEPAPVGTRLLLCFDVPLQASRTPLELLADVVRTDADGMGVAFVRPTLEAKEILGLLQRHTVLSRGAATGWSVHGQAEGG
jgi:hypothetical protein